MGVPGGQSYHIRSQGVSETHTHVYSGRADSSCPPVSNGCCQQRQGHRAGWRPGPLFQSISQQRGHSAAWRSLVAPLITQSYSMLFNTDLKPQCLQVTEAHLLHESLALTASKYTAGKSHHNDFKVSSAPIVFIRFDLLYFSFSAFVLDNKIHLYLHSLCILLWRVAGRTDSEATQKSPSQSPGSNPEPSYSECGANHFTTAPTTKFKLCHSVNNWPSWGFDELSRLL